MMLETVKKTIREQKNSSFDAYFRDFLCRVQDENMENEIHFLAKHNLLCALSMELLLQNAYERLRYLC